ncbi:MAG TPA: lytic murein transglycosylase [Azospirillaceae bacterium]|nr:lytic murein transglycosylase [Azospirillaceae bacterium]
MRRAMGILAVLAGVLGAGPAAATPDFGQWLDQLRGEARTKGISDRTLETALSGVQPIPRVIELDRRQPEGSISFETYVKRVLTPARVKKGRELYAKHKAVLTEVGKKYGVQPRFIVALWGIETGFGSNTGGFKVVDALATLAHDGRRSDYFRRELLNALTILEEGHIAPTAMKGSWAGAMGQSQFMPSSFLKYAQDFDGDGRRDIWGTQADVFASAANYLSTVGWDPDQTWGREVRLPKKAFDPAAVAGLDKARPLSDWGRMGVRAADGKPLPKRSLKAALVIPDGPKGRAFLVYDNYRTIMDWNRSTYFATTVGLLADRIGDRP